MPTKSQKKTEDATDGVPVRTFDNRTRHYDDGVPVRIETTTDEPEQTAGTEDGQSAGNKEK